MLPPFDIFKVETTGGVLWVGASSDLKSAKLRVRELMASSPSEYLVLSHRTNNKLILKPPRAIQRTSKPVIFQIAYDEHLLAARSKLLTAAGCEVISVLGNEAAKEALGTFATYDLFMIGHGAPEEIREEMAAWLKVHYPSVPILALNPPESEQLDGADYNIRLNGPEEWLTVVESVTAL